MINLTFISPHKSIKNEKQIGDCALPDFTVLTGLNGSGKSHILEAIHKGHIACKGINHKAVSLLSHDKMQEQQVQASYVQKQCEEFLKNRGSDSSQALRRKISSIYDKHLVYRDACTHHFLLKEVKEGTPIWSIKKTDVSSELWKKISAFKTNMGQEIFADATFREFPFHEHLKRSYISHGIVSQAKGFHYSEFVDVVGVQTLEELTQIFTDYEQAGANHALEQFSSDRYGKRSDFVDEYYQEREPPWVIMNEAFAELKHNDVSGLFDFQITHPGHASWAPDVGSKILNGSTDATISFNELSSGERVVFSLIMMVVGERKGWVPPQLLLLDEIDATLHPSIIKRMKNIIENVFIERGTKVILATHSPTTLSLMDDHCMHQVRPGLIEDKIIKVSKPEALKALTEGYVTLQDLVSITDTNRDFVVLSEGRNCRYLEKARSFFDSDNRIEILNIEDFGTNQLREIFKFLSLVNKTKKFVTVWDCDYRKKNKRDANGNINKDANGNTIYINRDLNDLLDNRDEFNRAYIFEQNAVSQYSKGIENLFKPEHTSPLGFDADNGKAPKNKTGFEQAVLKLDEPEIFANFEPLFKFILDELADG